MILTLYGLRADLDPVYHQILASPTIPSMEEVFARLLRIYSPIVTHVENPSPDSSILISHSGTRGCLGRGGRGRGHPQCTHCNRMGHTREVLPTDWLSSDNASEYFSTSFQHFMTSQDKNRYFTSTDVTFFEESSFFSSAISESPLLSEALPVPYLGPNDHASSAPLLDLPADTVDVLDDSLSIPTPSHALDPASPPILRKGTRSTRNPYPIYTFLSYHRLSSPYYAFVSSLSSISVPKSTSDALAHLG
ncbi:Retrovirus-related Pol polyprotein from transposon TNT 1-94 [Quillaja saponaria]|uniref:Retrovirus-related Pol polyprotein from transposon TNT 1-94 n=1 Tax=Quillaja saponaria TaxID=32244 RepID=A0AAD7PL26_QUISA|nr:Retrovirus-related Pol polyprotein from transposon TNT 1-94 [Quillaja saponaria]